MPHKKNLDAWNISERDFPNSGSLVEKIRFCLQYAILAPSTHNTQPWFFEVDGQMVSLYADRRHALPVADPDDRELMISCASALYNLRLALRYFGLGETTQLIPNPADEDLLASIQVQEAPGPITDEERALFRQIKRRHFNRGALEAREVPPDILKRLKDAAAAEDAWLYICEGDEREVVGHFIAEGDHIQMSNKAFRRELAAWIHERRFESGDGLPHYARPQGELMRSSRPRIVRRFETEPGKVVQDHEIAKHSPVLAILGSPGGGHVNRLYAGQALMRVLLQAQLEGLSATMLNQPCEVPDLRLRLYDEIDHRLGRAHIILRLGYGDPAVSVSPRRPLQNAVEIVTPGFSPGLSQKTLAATNQNAAKKSLWWKMRGLFRSL